MNYDERCSIELCLKFFSAFNFLEAEIIYKIFHCPNLTYTGEFSKFVDSLNEKVNEKEIKNKILEMQKNGWLTINSENLEIKTISISLSKSFIDKLILKDYSYEDFQKSKSNF